MGDVNGEEELDYDETSLVSSTEVEKGAEKPAEGGEEDPELEDMKKRVKEMEDEAAKLRQMQSEVEKQVTGANGGNASGASSAAATAPMSAEAKEEVDSRSIFVGSVDYGATPEEVQQHFASCGTINRITIVCDSYTGKPKGFAYVEFADVEAVNNAQALNESVLRGRQLKVTPKRTNVPGLKMRGRGGFRGGRGGRGRGGFRGHPRGMFRGGRGFRGRGYHPYA
eukprot:Nk52_evm34s359 gene=Nk52_evmTU34s359